MQKQVQTQRIRCRGVDTSRCRNAHCSRIANETRVAITGATEVHRALCAPEWQRFGPYEIVSRVLPARYISGDFVCSVPHSGGTFLVLGDLMGKGLSAAMWITHILDLVHRAAERSRTVCEFLGQLNTEVAESRIRVPLTSVVALSIDETSGEVSVGSAGHPSALIVRRGARVETSTAGGPLLGVFTAATYQSQSVYLDRGDSIIAFSDGLVESLEGDDFSLESVVAIAAREALSEPVAKMSRIIQASSASANGTPRDDTSILIVQRL
ncbi:MAG: PP2C family protein-serine/threonine phosphatase [Acidobacteriaceae bacterium]